MNYVNCYTYFYQLNQFGHARQIKLIFCIRVDFENLMYIFSFFLDPKKPIRILETKIGIFELGPLEKGIVIWVRKIIFTK